ncbi:Clp protease N-terminal domain-containing protein [Actinomadura rupiterrae]|uniref:Clp protease N-terminal domain-containing protein n=1 Tax=Actinomadura rupiterrae TaxID=559627 RepID=UPI0020A401D8|nr:Clp protease N-terminal domain-containing protein [Actinomadura rupiterrae]MCP2338121.1 ATP-dependent Clp protease ATP-binding subunit ClpA [Actinomadura rupiterrae]
MFERFTDGARKVVKDAQEEARSRGDRAIGTEHLLFALTRDDGPAGEALRDSGLFRGAAGDAVAALPDPSGLDGEALRLLGIDLDAVREAAEDAFGPGALDAPSGSRRNRSPKGHIPFKPESKKALELSLRQALNLKHGYIGSGHILLGLLQDRRFRAARALSGAGMDLEALRADVIRRIPPKAA